MIDAQLAEFPAGQPGALEQRPGLVHDHVAERVVLVQRADHPEGRAPAQAGEGAGVAVRVDAEPPAAAGLPEPPGAAPAEPVAHRVGEPGRRQGRRLDGVAALGYPLRDRQHLAAEVDGRRPGVGDALDLSVQPRPVPALPVALADGQGDAQRAGHAEQRRAAHGERGDRLDQLIDRGDAQHADLMRQHGLVQGLDVPVAPGEHVRCVHTANLRGPCPASGPGLLARR